MSTEAQVLAMCEMREFRTSAASRLLLNALIYFLDLRVKDPESWPALETILYNALQAERAKVWEEAAVMVEQDCFGDVAVEFDSITKEQYAHNLNQIELARRIRQRSNHG